MPFTDGKRPEDQQLAARMRADPNLAAIVKQRRQGRLSAAELRQLGYDVPDGYSYTFGGRAGLGTLMDNKQNWVETGKPALIMGAIAGAGAAGLVPGIAGFKKLFGGGGDGDGGGFGARDWLDLILGGGQTVAGLWGANQAANASKEAAEIQAAAYREGLDFLKQQWTKYNEDFKPYLDAGHAAIGRLSAHMAGQTPPAMPASVQRRLTGPGDTYTPGGVHVPMTLGTFGQTRRPTPTPAPVDPATAFGNKPLPERYPTDGEGSRGLGYWARQGVDPARDMFDPNGQLKPGWRRTANGYERDVAPTSTTMPVPGPMPPPTVIGADAPSASMAKPVTLGQFGQQQPVSTAMPVGGGGMVRMKAPTGEEEDVPAYKVPMFMSKGARVVASAGARA